MKKIIIFIILLLNFINIYSDESVDSNNVTNQYKFRGKVELGFGYYWDMWQGEKNDKFGDFLYKKMDYTNTGDPDNHHHDDDKSGRTFGGWGGIEFGLFGQYSFIAPFLTGKNFLFSGNNIKMNLNAKINPVSVGSGIDFVVTPIAFYYFTLGASINGAWCFPTLGGIGVAKNVKGQPESYIFSGPVVEVYFENTLQFDTAYLMPKNYQRWTHFLFVASAMFKYKALLTVAENQPFYYENDTGENLNGWKFYSSFIVGYKIPIIIDDIGENDRFLKYYNNNFSIILVMYTQIDCLDLTHYYDSPMSKNGWGSDFITIKFSPVINFEFPRNYFLLLQFQFANEKRFTEETVGNKFYQDKIYEDYYIYFRRIAFSFGWKF